MPLDTPRKNDGWDGFRDMVAFPAADRDTGVAVSCAVSEEALGVHFVAERGNITSLFRAFRHHRAMIEQVASDKYDALGRPNFVVLLAADFAGRDLGEPPSYRSAEAAGDVVLGPLVLGRREQRLGRAEFDEVP